MWYNNQLKTKAPRSHSSHYRTRYQNSVSQNFVNPRERLMNNQKRQKLRDLLIERFSQKYNIVGKKHIIEGEITKFLQQEKLNDVDLQRLDNRIKRIISENLSQNDLKNNLTKSLNYNRQQPEGEYVQNNNNFQPEEESIYPANYQPPAESPNYRRNYNTNNIKLDNNSKKRASSSQNQKYSQPLSSQTFIRNDKINLAKNKKIYKNPEEELADLEAELAAEEEREMRESGYYHELNNDLKKIDFRKYGNEWAAMAAYDKMLYEQQMLDEKIRNRQQKKRTKYDLDEQVKYKIKKEYEDELKEKEYDKLFREHQKKLDEIEKEKEELIKQQYLREKESREAQLKDNYVRRRIDELKEKKLDKKIIKNIKNEMERERNEMLEEKRKRWTELNKALQENENNRKNQKKILEKEREEDLKFLEEERKMDMRREQEREYLLNTIKNNGNKYINKKAEEKLEQIKKDQEEEEKKVIFYMNEKARIADEKEQKEKLRREKEKKELKKYYDMQVEEKRKDNEFEKILDGEQARIWKMDCEKYNQDTKRIAGIIRAKNKKNLEKIKQQIKDREEKEKNKYGMSDIEFAMNRQKLMKVHEALG